CYIDSTCNANPGSPHLLFSILALRPERQWCTRPAINPYPLLGRKPRSSRRPCGSGFLRLLLFVDVCARANTSRLMQLPRSRPRLDSVDQRRQRLPHVVAQGRLRVGDRVQVVVLEVAALRGNRFEQERPQRHVEERG